MSFTEFEDLFSQYDGEQELGEVCIYFSSVNTLKDYWGKEHRTLCKITVGQSVNEPKIYHVYLDEATCSIIGGSACGQLTKEEAIERVKFGLDKYCFRHKKNSQMSLF